MNNLLQAKLFTNDFLYLIWKVHDEVEEFLVIAIPYYWHPCKQLNVI